MQDTKDVLLCCDCAMLVAYDDDSGIDPEDYDRIIEAFNTRELDLTLGNVEDIISTDESCYICGADYYGDRRPFTVWL